jgi:site-specific recombinase XerD
MLVSAGTNVRVVSDLLGHATVGFTLGVYTHPPVTVRHWVAWNDR